MIHNYETGNENNADMMNATVIEEDFSRIEQNRFG